MEDTPTPIAEIDHGPSKFEIFMEENQKKLIIGAIVIFLGVLAYVFFSGYGEMKEQNAGADVTQATTAEEYEKAIQQHPESRAAGAATILLANAEGQSSNQDAIDELKSFLSKFPDHAAAPTAQVSLGLRLLDEGKPGDAEGHLNSVLDMEGAEYIAPLAKLALGDIALNGGNKEKAKSLYTEVSKLTRDGTQESINKYQGYINMANERLRLMNAKAPRVVEPKPATTPAPQPSSPEAATGEAAKPEQENTEAAQPAENAEETATPEENADKQENQEKNSQE